MCHKMGLWKTEDNEQVPNLAPFLEVEMQNDLEWQKKLLWAAYASRDFGSVTSEKPLDTLDKHPS